MRHAPIERHELETDNGDDARVTVETIGHEDELVVLAMVGPEGEQIRSMPSSRMSVVLNAAEAASLMRALWPWLRSAAIREEVGP